MRLILDKKETQWRILTPPLTVLLAFELLDLDAIEDLLKHELFKRLAADDRKCPIDEGSLLHLILLLNFLGMRVSVQHDDRVGEDVRDFVVVES